MKSLQPYIPYSGNKYRARKYMLELVRKYVGVKYIISPFCGGGALEIDWARNGYTVLAGDLDKGLIELHRKIVGGDKIENKFVSKEEFYKIRKDETWEAAYARQVYSFSNAQKSYAFSDERLKGPIDKLVEIPQRYRHISDYMAIPKSSLALWFLWGDYRDVCKYYIDTMLKGVPKEQILIYLDPPYKNTKGYISGKFNHDEFYDWVRSLDCNVLVSEYNMPEDFHEVYQKQRISYAGGQLEKRDVVEKIYSTKPLPRKLAL